MAEKTEKTDVTALEKDAAPLVVHPNEKSDVYENVQVNDDGSKTNMNSKLKEGEENILPTNGPSDKESEDKLAGLNMVNDDVSKTDVNSKWEGEENNLPSDEESEDELEGLNMAAGYFSLPKEKTMDMKMLEDCIFDLFTDMNKEETTEQDSKETKCQEVKGCLTFSRVLNELPKKLPPEYAAILSPGVVLSALLQVATDKILHIEGTSDLSDLIISQDQKLA